MCCTTASCNGILVRIDSDRTERQEGQCLIKAKGSMMNCCEEFGVLSRGKYDTILLGGGSRVSKKHQVSKKSLSW